MLSKQWVMKLYCYKYMVFNVVMVMATFHCHTFFFFFLPYGDFSTSYLLYCLYKTLFLTPWGRRHWVSTQKNSGVPLSLKRVVKTLIHCRVKTYIKSSCSFWMGWMKSSNIFEILVNYQSYIAFVLKVFPLWI